MSLAASQGRHVRRSLFCAVIASLAITACAGQTPGTGEAPEARPSGQGQALVMVVRYEITDLAPKIPGGGSPIITKRLFNAALALTDSSGAARPYLAEALPQLNTESWSVRPDGRMETTHRLRPDLTWHDGRPLTAEDFVFAWNVYTEPSLTIFGPTPQDQMEEVLAPDPQTILIRWGSPYPDAGVIDQEDLDALPRHILAQPFAEVKEEASAVERFLNHPYWTTEYVGLGPFQLERWEPGSQFDGSAFEGHALGRPKIDRVTVRVVPDENAVLTNVLAGNAHFTADFTLRFEHAQVLQREWVPAGGGTVLLKRSSPVSQTVQLRPDHVGDAALLDARVRRALAHTIDRQAINEGVFEGQGFMTETIVPSDAPYFRDVEQAVMKYPYDPRRAEQLMTEVGLRRDPEGFVAHPNGDRVQVDFRTFGGTEFERTQTILTDTWRRAGVDVQASVLPAAQVRDRQTAHTFPGLATRGGGLIEQTWTTAEIASAANRWVGNNRAGWSNAEYDRLWEAFNSTLDRAERMRQFVQMQRLLGEHLPVLITHFATQVNTHVASLHGPEIGTAGVGTLTPGTLQHWNIHEWEFR